MTFKADYFDLSTIAAVLQAKDQAQDPEFSRLVAFFGLDADLDPQAGEVIRDCLVENIDGLPAIQSTGFADLNALKAALDSAGLGAGDGCYMLTTDEDMNNGLRAQLDSRPIVRDSTFAEFESVLSKQPTPGNPKRTFC